MTAVTQAEFARQIGVAKSWITKLKTDGRIVMTADGLVDVEASRAKIAATADPNRDDVAQRFAAQRGTPLTPPAAESADKIGSSYQAARAVKEKFAAMTAKLEYERAIGKLVEKDAIARAIEDVITTVRQSLENLPHRTAAELVGKDLDSIRAILKHDVYQVLTEMEREFGKRLDQIAQTDAT